ncbi:hypothetical protein N9B31_05610 [Mariniblastus sp.]|nr:hypothetical protein [Mariniblastus sp.]
MKIRLCPASKALVTEGIGLAFQADAVVQRFQGGTGQRFQGGTGQRFQGGTGQPFQGGTGQPFQGEGGRLFPIDLTLGARQVQRCQVEVEQRYLVDNLTSGCDPPVVSRYRGVLLLT